MSKIKLNATMTAWRVTGRTSTGGKTFAAPLLIKVKTASVENNNFTLDGKIINYDTAVYCKDDLTVGDYIAEGDAINATPTTAARMVVKSIYNDSMTDLRKYLI